MLQQLPGQVQDNEDTFGLLEDLRGTIFRYQVRSLPAALPKIDKYGR
jgi:hypothetical protein